jgi:hypothetical protein
MKAWRAGFAKKRVMRGDIALYTNARNPSPMKTKNTKTAPRPVAMNRLPEQISAPGQTIAHTITMHQSDPQHHFHARAQPVDSRVSVAAGERLQRVRARAQAN